MFLILISKSRLIKVWCWSISDPSNNTSESHIKVFSWIFQNDVRHRNVFGNKECLLEWAHSKKDIFILCIFIKFMNNEIIFCLFWMICCGEKMLAYNALENMLQEHYWYSHRRIMNRKAYLDEHIQGRTSICFLLIKSCIHVYILLLLNGWMQAKRQDWAISILCHKHVQENYGSPLLDVQKIHLCGNCTNKQNTHKQCGIAAAVYICIL
jgi:hypothetical protein